MKLNQTIIIIPLLMLVSSCGGEKSEEQQPKPEGKNIPTVLVSTPLSRQFNAVVKISGSAKPNQEVRIFAMTSGFLDQLNSDIGDFVEEGQTLAVLKNPELISKKMQLEAKFNEQSLMKNWYTRNPESTPLGAEAAGKKAIYERLRSVYEKSPQLTTLAEVDQAKADYEATKANLELDKGRVEAAFLCLNAQLDAVNDQIGFLNIKSPFKGVVFNRFVDRGAIIQSGLNNANAMPLFEIQDLQPIRLTVDISETDAALIDKGTKVEITFPELLDVRLSAIVSRISYGLNETSKTMKAEIDLPNTDLRIRPGMYAKVEMQRSGHKYALSVPNEAIGNVKGQSFIYVVENGVVRKVEVNTGIRDEKFTELLSGGIRTSDKIVIQGKEFCNDGATVLTKEFITK
jgi:RND family efflux transporter MFP subunit